MLAPWGFRRGSPYFSNRLTVAFERARLYNLLKNSWSYQGIASAMPQVPQNNCRLFSRCVSSSARRRVFQQTV
jgi:hypothetical protein